MIPVLKSTLKSLAHMLADSVVCSSVPIQKNHLLLVHLDAIGDYVLFRNMIAFLKESKKYRNYKITLVGNAAWQELAELLDGGWIDHFIWLERRRFDRDLRYRYRKLREITACGYEIAVSPVFSREFGFGDAIMRKVRAQEKIGSIGDYSNIGRWRKKVSDRFYTKLLPAHGELMFEFYRNREFFECLLGEPCAMEKPVLRLPPSAVDAVLPQKYAVLFIGASMPFRKWPGNSFAQVARHLHKFHDYDIVLCGGPDDRAEAEVFAHEFGTNFLDLVGKTTLPELLQVIAQGDLMLANETSAPHLAVALEIKNVFVIYNGNHFGRFVPYPEAMRVPYHVIYHPAIEQNLDNYAYLSNSYGYGSDLDICEISVEKVIARLDEVLGTSPSFLAKIPST